VVGGADGPLGDGVFIWDQIHGMRDLQSMLIDEYGLGQSLAGWKLTDASGISMDGLTIVGGGVNPSGNLEAWLVRLDHPANVPEPQTAALLAFIAAACRVGRATARR
jgi:hypothetical protein